jgi:hypothetical protein
MTQSERNLKQAEATIAELRRQLKWCHRVFHLQLCIGLAAAVALIWMTIQKYPY